MARSVDAAGTLVPLNVNGHPPALPLVVQFIEVPLSVPAAEPLTGTPAQVALYAMVAAVSLVGVIVHAVEVHVPVAAVECHVPANALIAVGAGVVGVCGAVGAVTLPVVGVLLHAAKVRSKPSRAGSFRFTIHVSRRESIPPRRQLDGA
ncbi:MAG: hypothetical protein JWL71_141 [Acidobacteria bacterium]|nr:hypothetical protein [Acidobacteriota bacterium]